MKFLLRNCVIILAVSGSLHAQHKQVSLQECINIALENHPEIMAVMEDEKKAVANYNLSKSTNSILVNGELRTVEYLKATSSAGNYNLPGKDTTIGLFAGASATYNLYDANKYRRQDSARIGIDLAKMNGLKAQSTIILNVKMAYFGYAVARELTTLQNELRNKYTIKLEKTELLFKNGQRPILDVTKAQVDLASATLDYERAKNRENLSKTDLLASLGLIDEAVEIEPEKAAKLPVVKYSVDELYSLAESFYPDLRIAKMNQDLQRINIEVEKASRYPVIDLMGSMGFENKSLYGNDPLTNKLKPDNWEPAVHAGVQARVPIYSGGGIPAKIDAAKADYNRSFYNEKKILLSMKSLIKNYIQSMQELKKQIDLSILMRTNAEKHLALAQKSYDAGIGSQLDLKDAETAVLNAEVFFVRARYDYFMTLAKLSNTVGLGEEYLCEK